MRHFITHTTDNYEEITINLAKSIKKYSKYPLMVYTIDYDGSEKLKSIAVCKRINLGLPKPNESDFLELYGIPYVYRNSVRTFLSLGGKIDSMIDACDSGIDEWVYIDSDSVVNSNVDDLFDYCKEVSTFPLATKGPYEYILLTHQGDQVEGNPFWKNDGSTDLEATLEWPMMKFFCMKPEDRGVYHTTNILVGTKHVRQFLEVWRDCKNLFPKVTDVFKISPLQEETIYNVLSWKIKHSGLPMLYINVKGSDTVEHFFNNETEEDKFIQEYYLLPKNKELIKVFHGEKRQEQIDRIFELIDKNQSKKLKILFLAPHLSTGGMPSFLLKRIQSLMELSKDIEIFVVEFSNYSPTYIVQRKQIIELVGENRFWTLGEDKYELLDIIKNHNIDIVHVDEMVEGFDSFNQFPQHLATLLYDNQRTWRMVETCHNVWFNPYNDKIFHPDGYLFCTPWHKENTFKDMLSPMECSLFPIENKRITQEERIESKKLLGLDPNKKHVVNVGLWTRGKNQGEGVEVAKKLPDVEFLFIGNQAVNFIDYWEPIMKDIPSNVKVLGERDDVELFLKAADVFMFNSTWECNPLAVREAISMGLPVLSRNLPQYMDMFTDYLTIIDNDDVNIISKQVMECIDNPRNYEIPTGQKELFVESHLSFYKDIISNQPQKQFTNPKKIEFVFHCVNNPYFEIKSKQDSKYKVQIFDDKNNLHYEETISNNMWVKLAREYYTKWLVKVYQDDKLVYKNNFSLEGKRVFISFDSHSLGDTIAWIPYCLEFKKKHNCEVTVACKWSELFKDVYPELVFVPVGSTVHNLVAMYTLGWFWNDKKEPVNPVTIPLQKTASNILGLEHKEIRPRIKSFKKENPYNQKYVTIATHSTSGLKYWQNPTGWQELVDYLISKGYKVVSVSKEDCELKNIEKVEDCSIENTMNVIEHSEFFIGLSSGLSWLSWAMGKHVVMISNFTEKDHEFVSNCTRIIKPDVCNSCWNNPMFKFDKGDWWWCPEHKNTPRHFECHKSITGKMVIDSIQHLIQ